MARKEDLPVPWSVTRRQVVDAARSFIDVPYQHQGRSKRGVDCSGLIYLVCKKLEIPMRDTPVAYSSQPQGWQLIKPCEEQCWKPEDQRTLIPGDIVVFWGPNPKEPQHFGIIAPGHGVGGISLVHSFSKYGRVLEHGWNAWFSKHYWGRYLFPGTADGGFV